MAKDKKAKGQLPQKNVHLRLAYLHQAATYLENQRSQNISVDHSNGSSQLRYLISHLKGVSRKSVMRLHKDIKRSLCKGCDELLIPERTSIQVVENRSKNAAKSWADVLVIKCCTCDTVKRFPVDPGIREKRKAGTTTQASPDLH